MFTYFSKKRKVFYWKTHYWVLEPPVVIFVWLLFLFLFVCFLVFFFFFLNFKEIKWPRINSPVHTNAKFSFPFSLLATNLSAGMPQNFPCQKLLAGTGHGHGLLNLAAGLLQIPQPQSGSVGCSTTGSGWEDMGYWCILRCH